MPIGSDAGADRYEVRQAGEVIGRFGSVVAAATFARGKPATSIHPIRSSDEPE